jgi:hypothetical protein
LRLLWLRLLLLRLLRLLMPRPQLLRMRLLVLLESWWQLRHKRQLADAPQQGGRCPHIAWRPPLRRLTDAARQGLGLLLCGLFWRMRLGGQRQLPVYRLLLHLLLLS